MKTKPTKSDIQFPCEMYLRSVNHDSMYKFTATGETSRSWLEKYNYKWAKKDHVVPDKETYELWVWANR